jgi:chorismate mutase
MGVLVRHVLARGLRRPLLVVAIALVPTVFVLQGQLRKAPSYLATAMIRISETVRSVGTPAPPPARLREYIAVLALARPRLAEIMTRYRLGNPARTDDVEDLRDAIHFEVTNNYFLEDAGDEPRWALLVLSFESGSPETARGAVHDIVTGIVAHEAAARQQRVRVSREIYDAALQQARERIAEIDRELVRLVHDRDAVTAEVIGLTGAKKRALDRLISLEESVLDSAAAEHLEESGLALTFEIVNEELLAFGEALPAWEIVLRGLGLLVGFLLMGTVLVGAFDPRVHDTWDLSQLEVPILGALPAFPGDDAGARRRRWGR